jgi:hypothetical protein
MKAQHTSILASSAIVLFTGAAASTGQAASGIEALVAGPFQMQALVTKAVNVAGEHPGEHLQRHWTITPAQCSGSVCATLMVRRQRSAGIEETIALRHTGTGTYAGASSFYAPLRCRKVTYRHGERVPYRITLTITSVEMVQTIAYARQITATYTNPRRIDRTPCPLGPSHDAASYTGVALSPPSTPPVGAD